MNSWKKQKKKLFLPISIFLLSIMLMGCGKEPARESGKELAREDDKELTQEGDKKPAREDDKQLAQGGDEQPAHEDDKQPEEIAELSDEELSALQYIEKTVVEDYYGDMSEYDIYAPKDNTNEDGYVFWFDHGLSYSASAISLGSASFVYEYLDDVVEYTMEDWQAEGSEYTDVELGEIVENGDDRYRFVTAMREDFFGTPFQVKKIFYLDMQDTGAGVLWDLELSEMDVDEETDFIIDELAKCYRIDLNVLKSNGEWLERNAERVEQDQDVYEPREGDNELEQVEGYRYMGLTTLTADDGAVKCPVMVPMGSSTYIKDSTAYSGLHGVKTSARISRMIQTNFRSEVKGDSDIRYDSRVDDTEKSRNVWKSEMIPLSGFDEAYYVVITYEEQDYITQEYVPKVLVPCYIKIDEEYNLEYEITLSYDEYDNSTNTVIKELETAYGIDLSKYYFE